jgi:hypothetical protein
MARLHELLAGPSYPRFASALDHGSIGQAALMGRWPARTWGAG